MWLLCLYKRKVDSTSDVVAFFLRLAEAEEQTTYRRIGVMTDEGMGRDGGFCALLDGVPRRSFTIH